jgi:hypothetical protein
MRIKRILLPALVCLLVSAPIAGQKLPGKSKSLPEYLAESKKIQSDWEKSQTWQEWAVAKIKNNDFGQANTIVWNVYSDRANNTTYTEPNVSSAVHSTLAFMEQVKIAEIRNDFALLYKSEYFDAKDALKIKEATCFGWIPVDNLLLWEETPRTHSGIYQKALIINNLLKSRHIVANPPFYLEPNKKAEINNSAKDLDIYFVMKTATVDDTKYYLLSRGMLIGNNPQTVYGWIEEEYITEWNQRLALEPTHATQTVAYYKSKNIAPSIFYDMDDARQLWTNEKVQNPLWEYNDFSNQRMYSYTMRFPILEKGEIAADIYPVAAIVTLKSEIPQSITDKLEDLVAELKTKEEAQNLDIAIIVTKKMSLQKQKLKEILKSYNWTETEINACISYLKDGGNVIMNGYVPTKTSKSEYQLFDFVLFFAQTELEELIQQLSRINSFDVNSNPQAFQDSIVKIGQAMLGQLSEDEIRNMTMDKLLGQIYGIPVPLNLCKLGIQEIPNMDKADFKAYISVFRSRLEGLKRINSNSNYDGRFTRNHITYYWIPMEDMPGVYKDCAELKMK